MTLYIGRSKSGKVEVRDYKEGKAPQKKENFRTAQALVERVEWLENQLFQKNKDNQNLSFKDLLRGFKL